MIFRINTAPVGPKFQRYVGTKTHVRIVEHFWGAKGGHGDYETQENFLKQLHNQIVIPVLGDEDRDREYIRKKKFDFKVKYLLLSPHLKFMKHFTKFFQQWAHAKFEHPMTTGTYGLVLALSICDVVDAYSMQTPRAGSAY